MIGRARSSEFDARRGAAMVYVLVLLLLISMVGLTLVRGAVALHRQRRNDELHAQSVRLAEAGWNRAIQKLGGDPAYAGEVWPIPAEVLSGDRAALVRIEFVPIEDASTGSRLRVTAEYPLDSPAITRVTLQSPLPVLAAE